MEGWTREERLLAASTSTRLRARTGRRRRGRWPSCVRAFPLIGTDPNRCILKGVSAAHRPVQSPIGETGRVFMGGCPMYARIPGALAVLLLFHLAGARNSEGAPSAADRAN